MNSLLIRLPPKQMRSQQRVDLILKTAADVFAEVGYENATTNAIAERAGISIGSLYRYFPDKESILKSLVNQYRAEILTIFDQAFTIDAIYLPLPSLLDRLIDPFLEKHFASPISVQILLGADTSSEIAAAINELDQESIRRITQLLLRLFPTMGQQQAQLSAKVIKAILKSLVGLASASSDVEYRHTLIVEFKRVLLAYAESTFRNK